jgi:universal stress protein A
MEGYQNILCATDFSRHGQAAAERAAELAKFYGAQFTLLHVVEYFPEDRSNEQVAPENIDPADFREEQARAALAKLAKELGVDEVEQAVVFSTHSAKHAIVPFAGENNIDLIVIASHGHHGITALPGSTATGLAHSSPCDILLVRANSE